MTAAEKIEAGSRVYSQNCSACHQSDGLGLANAFPPLADSDYLNADTNRAIDVIIHGLAEEIIVNGERYNGVMPLLRLSDEDVANVLTYIYSTWGNSGAVVTPGEVARRR